MPAAAAADVVQPTARPHCKGKYKPWERIPGSSCWQQHCPMWSDVASTAGRVDDLPMSGAVSKFDVAADYLRVTTVQACT